MTNKGVLDIPTIGFGPGLEEYAHTVLDQVKEADLRPRSFMPEDSSFIYACQASDIPL